MADEPHDDADASQPGDPESSSDGSAMSDEQDAVATGFEVDDGEPQDFDAETGEYDAAPDEAIPDDLDDIEGDEPAEEFLLQEESTEEVAPEPAQPTETEDIDNEFRDEPAGEGDMHDGGAFADEKPTEAIPEDEPTFAPEPGPGAADQSQVDVEPLEEADEADFADDTPELEDETVASDLEVEDEAEGQPLAADSNAGDVDSDTPEEQPLGDEESDEEGVFPLQPELDSILDAPEPEPVDVEPMPEVGPYRDPATLTLWVAGDQQQTFAVAQDELVIGDGPSADADREDSETDIAPDIDLGVYLDSDAVWGRHAALYRHNKNYTLYAISDGATQINDEVLELGEHRRLEDGDIVVIGGELGLEFNLPEARDVAGQSAPPEADTGSADESADSEAELAVDSAGEPEFTDDSSTEELGADDLLDEQDAADEEQSALEELPDETPPPPGESGAFDDTNTEALEDADAISEDDWDDESVDDDFL
jgi:hypothetical protein